MTAILMRVGIVRVIEMRPIVFDLDGTLADTAEGIRLAVSDVVYGEGKRKFSRAETISFIGRGIPNLVSEACRLAGQTMDEYKLADFQRKLVIYQSSNTKLYDGVLGCLQDLQKMKIPLGVCTNKSKDATLQLLTELAILEFFDAFSFGDDEGEKKPSPAPLIACEKTLGVGPCIFVGDSETDEKTAKNAGRPFLLYSNGYRKKPAQSFLKFAEFNKYSNFLSLAQSIQ